jgi:hypothetical protein
MPTSVVAWTRNKISARYLSELQNRHGLRVALEMRFKVEIRDVPAALAARRLGQSETQFSEALPELLARGFPKPDPTTGFYDLEAIDAWCSARHPHLLLKFAKQARDASAVVPSRLKAGNRCAAAGSYLGGAEKL